MTVATTRLILFQTSTHFWHGKIRKQLCVHSMAPASFLFDVLKVLFGLSPLLAIASVFIFYGENDQLTTTKKKPADFTFDVD